MTIGDIYYFLIDGCAGAACDVTINVLGTCGNEEIEEIQPISGPTEVCVGDTAMFTGIKPNGANKLHWYVDGVEMQASSGPNATSFKRAWASPGTHEICMDASQDPCIPVTEDPEPSCLTVNVVQPTPVTITGNPGICPGGSTTLDAGPGFNSYLWSTGATTQTINVMAAGTYSVTVNVGSGCESSDAIVVTLFSSPSASASSNSPVCVGGTIQLNASGGVSYLWTGPAGFSSTLQSPSIPNATQSNAGTYSVIVTDGNGCTAAASTNVQVNVLPIASASSNSPICSGETLELMASGGVTYQWSGPNGFSSNQQNPNIPNASPLSAGSYTVTVTNADGCIHSTSTTVVIHPSPVAMASSNSPVCFGEDLMLSSSGGGTYQWSGPGGFSSSDQNPVIPNIDLSQAGTYAVSVTSSQGCSSVASTNVTVLDKAYPTITGSTSFCVGGYTILSANPGYSAYLWNTGATTEDIYVDQPGIYSVTVTDLNGCTGTDSVEVLVGLNLTPMIIGDTILCDSTLGALNAGPGFATYQWSTGQSGQVITIFSIGTYSVTVSDGAGCTGTDKVTVIGGATPKATAGSNGPVCAGQTIQLTAGGGGTYQWSGPSGFQSKDQNPNIPNANPGMEGTYQVIVTNSGGCSDTAWVVVKIGGGGAKLVADALIPECPGDTLFLYATGGKTYLWTGPDSFHSTLQNPYIPIAGPENSGLYIVSDTSVQGCVTKDTVQVLIPVGPIPEITGNLFICLGKEAVLDAGPGFRGYYWSNGKRGRVMTTKEPGIYWVLVTDGGCCIGVDSVEVVLTDTLNPDISGDTIICYGDTSTLDAGVGFATYRWSTGDTLQTIQVTKAGEYSVTVSNLGGCIGMDTVQFIVDSIAELSVEVLAISCGDSCDGQLEVLPILTGMNYLWSTGDTTRQLQQLCAGMYQVTISSAGGCTRVIEVPLMQPPPLSVVIEKVDSILNAIPSGGQPPYSYLWNNGLTTSWRPALPPGLHAVTVTDANGCKAFAVRLISSFQDPGEISRGIKLHPNPANGSVIISPLRGNSFVEALDYEIFNVLGVKLAEGRIQAGAAAVTLDTSMWASGSYIAQIRYREGGSETIPFVILH